ncbi:hypothetical protein HanIR_Chr13g0651261 [Helianthus annuus]|nr:hypothetical protein HanIR_Chr13g0651261 [Helianthus annuus]
MNFSFWVVIDFGVFEFIRHQATFEWWKGCRGVARWDHTAIHEGGVVASQSTS